MDHGRILDQGRHGDLLNQNERYATLVNTFLHDESETNLDKVVSSSEDDQIISQT